MAVENNVSIKSNSNLTQTGNTAKPQQYKVNPNGVDKTPEKDTVQLSTAKAVGIGAGIVAAAVGLFFLFRGKKPPTNIVKQTEQAVSHNKPSKQVVESSEKAVKQATEKVAKETEATVAKEAEAQVAKEVETTVAKETEAQVAKEAETTVAKETESQVAKETEPAVAKDAEVQVAKETEATVAKEVESQVVKEAEVKAVEEANVVEKSEVGIKSASKAPKEAETPKQVKTTETGVWSEEEFNARCLKAEADAADKKLYEDILRDIEKSKALDKEVDALMADTAFNERLNKFLDTSFFFCPRYQHGPYWPQKNTPETKTVNDFIRESILGEYKKPVDKIFHSTKSKRSLDEIINNGFSLDACSNNKTARGVYFSTMQDEAVGNYGDLLVSAKYTGRKVAEVKPLVLDDLSNLVQYDFIENVLGCNMDNISMHDEAICKRVMERLFTNKLQSMGYDAVHCSDIMQAGCLNQITVLDPKNIQIIK